jgi:type II secretory pathway pseudopilin PulG
MLAVLLMALLASAAALSFSGAMRSSRAADALTEIHSFDAAARQIAQRWNISQRIVFDLSDGTISRKQGPELEELAAQVRLPTGYQVDEIHTAGRSFADGEVIVDCSPMGLSRSYAVHVIGPGLDQWAVVAGLSGDLIKVQDENSADAMLDKAAPMAFRPFEAGGHDAH